MVEPNLGQIKLTIDELSETEWVQIESARLRGQRADDAIRNGQYLEEQLLTPAPWSGQLPSPKLAKRVIADLVALRSVIESCCDETLRLFDDPLPPNEFEKLRRGEPVVPPPTLVERLEFAEWLYPGDSAELAPGDKAMVTSILGRPSRYAVLEPTYILLRIWKNHGNEVTIGGKRNQSIHDRNSSRYRFAPMIEFVGDALLKIDPSLDTHEEDLPTTEADPAGRRTSLENARIVAWSCATQLRSLVHLENSREIRKLFEIDD